MIFGRVKPLEAILATAEKKALKRTLGAFQLTLFGIGCVIGTGIFVLTAAGAQKAGPGLMLAFAIAGAICIVAALCYAEIAAMIPVAGSAYTYTYASMGEFLAWTVGWALVLEYAVAASAVSVGWSGYATGTILEHGLGVHLPVWMTSAPLALGGVPGGFINLPAVLIALLMTWLLMIGTKESAWVNTALVAIKVTALTAFVILTLPSEHFSMERFNPFLPAGVFGGFGTGVGAVGAAATIFFAYVGFDAVSTAAEETKNPQRNVPIGLIGSLLFCTVFYILVAAGAIGTLGGQPIMGPNGIPFPTGSEELARQCAMPQYAEYLVCSNEALAHVLRSIGFSTVGNMLGIAAFVALPSVILILLFGQTRIFFVMSRDGLLPERLSRVHPKWRTPHVVTAMTGVGVAIGAAFFPVGQLADWANAGTLYAFMMVAICVMILRRTAASTKRSFRTPMLWLIGPATIVGCVFLFMNLPWQAIAVFGVWGLIGIVAYIVYGRHVSHLGRGIVEVHEPEIHDIEPPIPGVDEPGRACPAVIDETGKGGFGLPFSLRHDRVKGAMAETPPFALEGIDHVVLLVDDMAAARAFYLDVIGCTVENALPQYAMLQLRAGAALIDLVDISGEPGAWARPPVEGGRNVDHVCIATGAWDEAAMRAYLAAHGVAIVEEGVNGGARGESLSFYVKDPAGNVIELTGPPEAT